MQEVLRYARHVAVPKWLTPSLFAYLAVLAVAHLSWGDLDIGMFLPRLDGRRDTLTTLVALFGTTISPYLFFWQAAPEARDLNAYPRRRDLFQVPDQGSKALKRIGIDTLVGMGFSNLVALAITATTAACSMRTASPTYRPPRSPPRRYGRSPARSRSPSLRSAWLGRTLGGAGSRRLCGIRRRRGTALAGWLRASHLRSSRLLRHHRGRYARRHGRELGRPSTRRQHHR